ncbi:YqkE family protein [Paenibacillus sabuli]|uniref:YqkE family protein n=1 Tax=Paenibacillus sabuli TaxID=2772509 RepID=UPI001CC298C6|nr:YqkE family protein [Paenibacillus sabuli]
MGKKKQARAQRHQGPERTRAQGSNDRGDKRPSESLGSGGGATLKDLLSADTLNKLSNQAAQLKEEEARKQEAVREQARAEREAERKRRENDFAYLLDNSDPDWGKHKS